MPDSRCFVAVISSPSMRHDDVQKGFRNHDSGSFRSMTLARLSFLGRNNRVHSGMLWFFVGTLGGEHPVGCFRQMSSHRTDCDPMPLGRPKPRIQLRYMPRLQECVPQSDAVCRFDECPLQVMIHICRRMPIAHFPS